MARNTGTFAFSANFEPKIALPIDARMLVGTKADLITSAMLAPDGFNATYKGMIVSVANDSTPANNGIYVLTDTDYTIAGNWTRIGANESVVTDNSISGDGTSESPLAVDPAYVDHNSLDNYVAAEHALLNDVSAYMGEFSPSAHTPNLKDGTGTLGYFYVCTTNGTHDFGPVTPREVALVIGDVVQYNGSLWNKVSAFLWSSGKLGAYLAAKQSTSEKGNANGYASLDVNGKVPSSQLTIDALEYKGTFDPAAHTPNLKDGTGNTGDLYVATTAGTHDFGPVTPRSLTFSIGDWALYNGTLWDKVINSNISYTFSTGLTNTVGTITVNESAVNHNNLQNYSVTQHRTINDSGTGITDLWSASKISSEISGVAGTTLYTNEDLTPIAVGGIAIGETFDAQTITEMFDRLLYPTLYPAFVAPSMSSFTVLVDSSSVAIWEIGDVVDLDFTANFSRGSITPAYTTNGYRSGPANTYTYTGTGLPGTPVSSTSSTDNQSVTGYTIISGNNTWSVYTSHDIGQQPKDSKGVNYDSPYAAGAVSAINRTLVGTYPFFANTVAIGTQTKMALQALTTTTVTVSFVAEDGSTKQKLEVPEAFFAALTQVEQFSTVSQTWEVIQNGTTTFTKSSVYTIAVQGSNINYFSFTHNGATVGARQVRFTFSKS
jgi:hypothetical protein